MSGGRLILIGFVLLVVGWVLPFLMVMRVIEPTFALAFLAHGASVGGLFLGIIGAATYIRNRRTD